MRRWRGISRVVELHDFDGGRSDRTEFGRRESIEGSLKVIKYDSEYHPER